MDILYRMGAAGVGDAYCSLQTLLLTQEKYGSSPVIIYNRIRARSAGCHMPHTFNPQMLTIKARVISTTVCTHHKSKRTQVGCTSRRVSSSTSSAPSYSDESELSSSLCGSQSESSESVSTGTMISTSSWTASDTTGGKSGKG